MKRAMALDVGFKKIGVALSDPLMLTSYPYRVIFRKSNRETFEELLSIIEEKGVSDVVVGIPINREGKRTRIGEKIEKFVDKFKNFLSERGVRVRFHLFDESYSTLEAEELLRNLGKKREAVDDVAAALILREWLEERRDEKEEER
jgi:putative Holliday junction resolvase